MRSQGVPRVPFATEYAFAKILAASYRGMLRGLVGELAEAAQAAGFHVKQSEGSTVAVADADPFAVLRQAIRALAGRGVDAEALRVRLRAQMRSAESDFLTRLLSDADPRLVKVFLQMSVPAKQAFGARIDGLRELYLDQAQERIEGEQDDLKKAFLRRLSDWAEGKAERLDVSGLVREMEATSARRAKFFARDQFSRFNRALLVETYRQAEAPYVEWLTVGDSRVRPVPGAKLPGGSYHGLALGDHRVRNHKIYTIAGLLADPEYKSYNDRCGYRPVWGPLTADQQRRFVA